MPGALGGTSAGGISHQPSSSGGGGPTISFLSAAQLQSTMRPPGAISASGAAGDDLYDVEREMRNFWPRQKEKLEQMSVEQFREMHHRPEIPYSRIKRIMKIDDEVKNQMISSEVPGMFSKAVEIFVEELTLRAWVHAEENKRKTLQKNDIAMAATKYDQFDFLIDIIPRDEIKEIPKRESSASTMATATMAAAAAPTNMIQLGSGNSSMIPISADQLQYLMNQIPQQQNNIVNQIPQQQQQVAGIPVIHIGNSAGGSGQAQQSQVIQLGGNQSIQLITQSMVGGDENPNGAQNSHQLMQMVGGGGGGGGDEGQNLGQAQAHVFQQVIGPDGQMQLLPVALSQEQIQAIQQELQNQPQQQQIGAAENQNRVLYVQSVQGPK